MNKKALLLLSISHAAVDFGCAFLMFRFLRSDGNWALCILLYNFFAFAMQMPIGLVADRWNRNSLLAAIGCLTVLAAYALSAIPIAAAIIAGLGNGMFHVGGGLDVLNASEKRRGALGIFVSPGAIGLYLGTLLGKGTLPAITAMLALGLCGALLLLYRWKGPSLAGNAPVSLRLQGSSSPMAALAVFCLFFVVCVRGYVPMAIPASWRGEWLWAPLLVGASALGKASGGFLADRFGSLRVSIVSLGVAAALFLFGDVPILGLLAMLLFNMTMPITLWGVAKLLPGAKGFSFGLLTFGLFLGFLPVYLSIAPSAPWWMISVLSVVSLLPLAFSLKKVPE